MIRGGWMRLFGGLTQVTLFCALTLFSAYATFKYFVQSRPSFPAPNLVGLSVEDALGQVGALGFALRMTGRESSETAREGEVIAQQPEAGRIIREGGVVGVVVARSESQATLPNLVGLDIQQVRRLLEYHHLKMGRSLKIDRPDRRRDTVLGTFPFAGETVESGETIELLIADHLGQTPYLMPDLVGRPIGGALEALDRLGVSDIELDYRFREDWPDGIVLSQSPAKGRRFYPADGLRMSLNRKYAPVSPESDRVWRVAQYRVGPGLANKKAKLLLIDGGGLRALTENYIHPGAVFRYAYLARPGATAVLYINNEEKAQWSDGRAAKP